MSDRVSLFQETAPTTTPEQERRIRVAIVLALAAGLGYLTWRLTATLNPDALGVSLLLWGAEAWTFLTAALLFMATWHPFHREPPPPAPEGRSVDVFVPTLNEPVWIVRRALVGAIAIDYPHRTWLLDDGDRPEMRNLAEELGAGYLPRPGSEGAKAGHLNYALERTDGEFIAFFDADHVAMPEFLDRTLGYFTDERVAFVQTPQEFYNVDSYEHDVNHRRRRSWHEQTLFYRLIQPGKDRWNASFFCGSNGVIRRAALEDVGGFPTESITEDIHLSLIVHARGWRSVYQREVLAYGLAPQTAVAHLTQRLRWGQGGMQVLRKANPLTLPGLSPAQRAQYIMSFLPWFDGWQKLVFYAMPPIFLVTGMLPIRTEALHFALAFVGAYGLLLAAAKWAARGTAKLLLSDAYHAASFYTHIKATFGLFARKRLKFAVTDKEGQARVPVATAAPALVLISVSLLALVVGMWRFTTGQELRVVAFWVNVCWLALNVGLLGWGVWHMLSTREQRAVHRVAGEMPVDWSVGGVGGLGLLENFSEMGGRLRVRGALPEDDYVLVTFWPALYQRAIGKVRWRRNQGGGTVAGLEWVYLGPGGSPADLTALAMLFAQRRFLHLVDYATETGDQPDPLPVRLVESGDRGLLERQTTARGRLVVGEPVTVGERVRFAPWGDTEVLAGTTEAVRRVELPPYPVYEADLGGIGTAGRQLRSRASSDTTGRTLPPGWRLEDHPVCLGATIDGPAASPQELDEVLDRPVDVVQLRLTGPFIVPPFQTLDFSAGGHPRAVVLCFPLDRQLLRQGGLDRWLRRWFTEISRAPRPVYLRPVGDRVGGEDFAHLKNLAAQVGAGGLRWVWSVPEQGDPGQEPPAEADVVAVSAGMEDQPHAGLLDLHQRLAELGDRPTWLMLLMRRSPHADLSEWLQALLALGALPNLQAVVLDEPLPERGSAPAVAAARLLARAIDAE